MRSWLPTLSSAGEPERLTGARVSADCFGMLRVRPAVGWNFATAEDAPSGWRVAIISDQLDGSPFRIVGVLPPEFEALIEQQFHQRADIWAPVGYDATLTYACRRCRHLRAVGRLRDRRAGAGRDSRTSAWRRVLLTGT